MISTTNSYKKKNEQALRDGIVFKVDYGQINNTAKPSIFSVTSLSSLKYGSLNKTIDDNFNSVPYGSFEGEGLPLDGTRIFPSENADIASNSIPWLNSLSNDRGSFSDYPSITFNWNETIEVSGLTITFSQELNEYAKSVLLSFGTGGPYPTLKTYTGSSYQLVIEEPMSFSQLQIIINSWNKPNSSPKISEIEFGVHKEFDKKSIISASVLEQEDIYGGTIPINELTVKVENVDGKYDIFNPAGLFKFLQKGQPLNLTMGLETDTSYDSFLKGSYYLNNWEVNEGTLTLYAHNLWVETQKYCRNKFYQNAYLRDILVDLLTWAGITNYNVPLSGPFTTKLTVLLRNTYLIRDEIAKILIAYNVYFRIEPNNSVSFWYWIPATSDTVIKESLAESPYISTLPAIRDIYISLTETVIDAEKTPEIASSRTSVPIDGSLYYVVKFEPALVTAADITLIDHAGYTELYQIISIDIDSITVQLVNNDSQMEGDVTIVVAGRKISEVVTQYVRSNSEDGDDYTIDSRYIQTAQQAVEAANAIKEKSAYKYQLESNWRQDPSIEINDKITIETEFGAVKGIVVEQRYEYNGGLKGTTVVRSDGSAI